MEQMKSFFMNIFYTIKAFVDAVLADIYLRIELVLTMFLIFFAYAYNLDRTGWAVLTVSCAFAVAMQTVYQSSKNKDNRFSIAAASAVAAAGALFVCLFLFTDKELIKMAILNIVYSRHAKFIFASLFVIGVLFVAWFEKPMKKRR